ncbi:MAG: hypothetical protein HY658_06185 [Actinobacteria bacterium]|nr:hypothetical protein [Actinomycetota bacterium]
MISPRRLAAAATLAGALVLLAPGPAALAHPLGNFTVNTSSGLVVVPGEIRVGYVLDLAEIPAFQEMAYLDADVDGKASPGELAAWATTKAGELRRHLELSVDGRPVGLRVDCASAELLPGQGGLDTIRLEVGYGAEVGERGLARYSDGNFAELIGWREVSVAGAGGVALSGSTVPVESPSDRLRSYPEDLLQDPADVTEATFSFAPSEEERDGSAVLPCGDRVAPAPAPVASPAPGGFAGLVTRSELGPGVVVLSILLAAGFGALHALAPGHGKTITAAYLVGAGGRAGQAVAVGLAVATMHTASVLVLGAVVLGAERLVPAERVYPWLGLLAGLVAVGLGLWLLVVRIRAWRPHHAGHDHPHAHPPEGTGRGLLSRRSLAAIALSGGLLPSPTALLVLLAGVAAHRVALALGLIAAFGLGLATSLALVATLAVRTRDALGRRLGGAASRAVSLGSAGVIMGMGGFLVARGLGGL